LAAQIFFLRLFALLKGKFLLAVDQAAEKWLLTRVAGVNRTLLEGKLERLFKEEIIGVLKALIQKEALSLACLQRKLLDFGLQLESFFKLIRGPLVVDFIDRGFALRTGEVAE